MKVALLMIALLLSARAQESPRRHLDSAEGVSLEEAVRRAFERNGELLAERKALEEAQGRLRQAGLRANPMLDVMGGTSVNDRGMNEVNVGVSLPLELGGRRARRVEVADRELTRMRLEIGDRERRLAAEVRLKYGEAIAAARNLDLVARLVDLNGRSYELVRARVEAGVSAPLEQSQMRVEVGRLDAQRTTLGARLDLLLEELKNLLGMAPEEPLLLRDEFAAPPTSLLTKEQAIAQALASRPDLAAAREAEALADAMIEQARAEGRFDVSLFTQFGRQALRFDQLGISPESGERERVMMTNYMVRGGVSIALPVRNRNQGTIEAAVAARETARLRRVFLESVVHREVTTAFIRRDGAARVLKTFDLELLAASRNNLRIAQASYELGHLRMTDVLSEQRRLVEIEMSHNEALQEHFLSSVELESALGNPARTRRNP
ncbi:MAG: TolC family protein [Blastocatellia bacterium]|nr:TolC family protein [Blastocatellia bacterium]